LQKSSQQSRAESACRWENGVAGRPVDVLVPSSPRIEARVPCSAQSVFALSQESENDAAGDAAVGPAADGDLFLLGHDETPISI